MDIAHCNQLVDSLIDRCQECKAIGPWPVCYKQEHVLSAYWEVLHLPYYKFDSWSKDRYSIALIWFQYTGSFRKKGKSKTFFLGTKFHEKLIFSAFFSRELATNLRSWASRSAKITLWYPEKLAPPVCFQALVGCLKPTTDPETFSKDHKGVFWFVWGKNGSTKEYECVHTADFATYKSKHNEWLAL